jgi:hypothetical protein
MRLRTLAAGTASLLAVAVTLTAATADAATRKRVRPAHQPTQFVVRPLDSTRITTIGEDGVVRTRYVAVHRSFLDPGTEVSPGELPYTSGLSLIPAYSPTANIDVASPSGSFRRGPLSDPWDLPGFPKW